MGDAKSGVTFFLLVTTVFFSVVTVTRGGCSKPFDVVLLIDDSSNVHEGDFNTNVRSFLQNIVSGDYFEVSEQMVHVGIVQFASVDRVDSPQNLYCNKKEEPEVLEVHVLDGDQAAMQANIASMTWRGGQATTGHGAEVGLQMMRDFGRCEVLFFFILITNGKPNCDVVNGVSFDDSYAIQMGNEARAFGAINLVVDVGNRQDNADTILAFTGGDLENIFPIADITALNTVIESISERSCSYEITCTPDCINGACVATDTCQCNPGWSGPGCTTPTCTSCPTNSDCVAPEVCICRTPDWTGVPNGVCYPVCDAPVCWDHSSCIAPDTCDCDLGYSLTAPQLCEPDCVPADCGVNAQCVGPADCQCDPGYNGVPETVCFPVCTIPCAVNADCVSPNNCTCDSGYLPEPNAETLCVPDCNDECVQNSTCASPNFCQCDPGFLGDGKVLCSPQCTGASECALLATCTAPQNCVCNSGYSGDPYELCEPNCSTCGIRTICTGPEICECEEGYVGQPTPYDGCGAFCSEELCTRNSTCIGPATCSCDTGFGGDPYTECYPVCTGGCGDNSECVDPDVCECTDGYDGDPCDPVCTGGCPANSQCINPEECLCDDGYILDDGECVAVCQPGCGVLANCTAPFVCQCFAGYAGDPYAENGCLPVCEDCPENSLCISPGECVCEDRYEVVCDPGCICEPICTTACGTNAYCDSPDTCLCITDYVGDPYFQCDYFCAGHPCASEHATCIFRDICECDDGYEGDPFVLCEDVCGSVSCGPRASCNSDAVCYCPTGYEGDDPDTSGCIPVCTGGCIDFAECVNPGQCSCLTGYVGNPYYTCVPVCNDGCVTNGHCETPDECECDSGYIGDANAPSGSCSPVCVGGCGTNAYCSAPAICTCTSGFSGNPYYACDEECVSPCGDNADCTGVDQTCECLTGYEGNPYSVCAAVCAEECGINAICSAPDTCSCRDGFYGDPDVKCSASCFPACGKNAQCSDIDSRCYCLDNFEGNPYDECYHICLPQCGINAYCQAFNSCACEEGSYGDPLDECIGYCGCGVNAFCSDNTQCKCEDGYSGDHFVICDPVCYGCGPQTYCSAPGVCNCTDGYGGDPYDIVDGCDDVLFNCWGENAVVGCNSPNGTCISENYCNCTSDYHGVTCQSWYCFLVDNVENKACGTHGTCIGPNMCICEEGYSLNIVKNKCEKPKDNSPSSTVDVVLPTIVGTSGSLLVLLCLGGALVLFISSISVSIRSNKMKSQIVPQNKMFPDGWEDAQRKDFGKDDNSDEDDDGDIIEATYEKKDGNFQAKDDSEKSQDEVDGNVPDLQKKSEEDDGVHDHGLERKKRVEKYREKEKEKTFFEAVAISTQALIGNDKEQKDLSDDPRDTDNQSNNKWKGKKEFSFPKTNAKEQLLKEEQKIQKMIERKEKEKEKEKEDRLAKIERDSVFSNKSMDDLAMKMVMQLHETQSANETKDDEKKKVETEVDDSIYDFEDGESETPIGTTTTSNVPDFFGATIPGDREKEEKALIRETDEVDPDEHVEQNEVAVVEKQILLQKDLEEDQEDENVDELLKKGTEKRGLFDTLLNALPAKKRGTLGDDLDNYDFDGDSDNLGEELEFLDNL